jgi:hypothetical protein
MRKSQLYLYNLFAGREEDSGRCKRCRFDLLERAIHGYEMTRSGDAHPGFRLLELLTCREEENNNAGRRKVRVEESIMVVHGPEAFDQGDVLRFQKILFPRRTLVAGVMARTAAEESGLPVEFSGEPPSILIRRLGEEVILLNRGKTPESGFLFGEIVSRRIGERGLLHLECSSQTLYLWNNPDGDLGKEVAERTGFRPISRQSSPEPGSTKRRAIRGCLPGEVVCINGLVIGRATAETVVIERAGDRIKVVSGLKPKPHGLEKLHRAPCAVDLSTLWCKSGPIRTFPSRVHREAPPTGRVAVIDHCGHDIYRVLDRSLCGILAIGDDTTCVCGHIAAHRGIPILGVVDGDADHLVEPCFTPGSVVVQVDAGTDDLVGEELAATVTGEPVFWESWVQEMLRLLNGRGFVVTRL